ncbi:DUF418 domain-containing protein [Chitinimonas sp.]|uniref:DUF418 domain-containing protein n=1 Tax=Chitinimonas sp. TaxID=1934313 RepID=UPI002F92A203
MQVPASARILGFDLARALAIVGMVIVNFKTVMHSSHEGTEGGWRLFNLVDGRASALFVMLAGIGLSLLVRSTQLGADPAVFAQRRQQLLRRALCLFVLGLCYLPIWPADILHYYGVYIALGTLLLGWSSAALLTMAALLVAGFAGLFLTLRYDTAWNWQTLGYADLWTAEGFVRNLFYNGFHPVLPWAAFLLAGIVVGRLELQTTAARRRLLLLGLAGSLLAEGLAVLLRPLSGGLWAATQPMPPLPLYMLAAGSSACVIIAACLAITERYRNAAWLQPLVHTGQLALTLYVAHVVVGMGVLDAIGLLERQPLSFAVGSALLFCVTAVFFAHLWRLRFKLGPLEWLLRWLSEPAAVPRLKPRG